MIHQLAFSVFAMCDTDVSWLIVYPSSPLHLGGKSSSREK